jgi:hypothetical protein
MTKMDGIWEWLIPLLGIGFVGICITGYFAFWGFILYLAYKLVMHIIGS